MIPHEQLAEEIKFRKCVSNAIEIVQKRLIKESIERLNDELKFRNIVQNLILEAATEDPERDPHPATGINVLEDLLKKIIPVIETDFKVLTTSIDQRASFRAHVIHAVRNTLAPVRANEESPEKLAEGIKDTVVKTLAGLMLSSGLLGGAAQATPKAPGASPPPLEQMLPSIEDELEKLSDEDLLQAYVVTSAQESPEQSKNALADLAEKVPLERLAVKGKGFGLKLKGQLPKNTLDEDVDINIEDKDEEEKFIDIDGDGKPDKEEEKDPREEFGLDGEDETGRNAAYNTFKKIENQIVDAYGLLGNVEDQGIFYDYLITNLKLYFDKFEDELSPNLQEPTTDTYEKEKQNQDLGEEPAL